MASPKKIFFSYSSNSDDLELYNKIHKHFAAYSSIGLLGIIDKNEIFRISNDKSKVADILKNSDVTIPLLSIDFINDAECLQQLESAVSNQKTIVPILLRDFDWEAFQKLTQYKNQMLPNDLNSVEKHISADNNDDTVFKEIAQSVKAIIFPEIGRFEIQQSSHAFYYIIASIVLVIGVLAAWFIYDQQADYRISIAAFLMSVIIAMIALKNVLFPNKINIKR